MGILSFERLKSGLRRTRESLFGKVQSIISLKPAIDDDLLAHLEETLIESQMTCTPGNLGEAKTGIDGVQESLNAIFVHRIVFMGIFP